MANTPPILKEDLGLGKQAEQVTQYRMLNRDGSFNTRKIGLSFSERLDLYNTFLEMQWRWFYATMLGAFVVMNAIFAFVLSFAPASIQGGTPEMPFLNAFFFSVQTFATIGYGVLSPNGVFANLMVVVISLSGIIFSALATGLIFARFSRPMAKILYSRDALMSPFKTGRAFMFRVTNMRRSQLLDVQVRLIFARMEGGIRRFHRLEVEYDKIMFMPQHWTIVHEITEKSPLWGVTDEAFKADDGEIIILLTAVDDAFSQMVHSRFSYDGQEIVWGAKFESMFIDAEDGRVTVDLRRLHDWQAVPLPDFSPSASTTHHDNIAAISALK